MRFRLWTRTSTSNLGCDQLRTHLRIGARPFWVGSFQRGDDRSGIISARMRSTDGAPGAERRPYRDAAHYYKARPPYSAALRPALAEKLGWTGTGRLLDIGCRPGIVALE